MSLCISCSFQQGQTPESYSIIEDMYDKFAIPSKNPQLIVVIVSVSLSLSLVRHTSFTKRL